MAVLEASDDARRTPGAGTPGEQSLRRVLCVDDDLLLARLLMRQLSLLGYEVCAVSSGSEALAKLDAEPRRFDALVTDYHMPGMNGGELARRATELQPGMVVVLLTGSIDDGFIAVEDRARVDRILHKPFKLEALEQTLTEALAARR